MTTELLTRSLDLLMALLDIPSPTGQETAKAHYIQSWVDRVTDSPSQTLNDSIRVTFNPEKTGPHLVFIGHTDTVPAFFKPKKSETKISGSGASDMQAGLAAMMGFIEAYLPDLCDRYKLSFIAYAREENTPLPENGLYQLIEEDSGWFDGIDLAILGEPTNNTIQIGCVGSAHAKVTVPGKSCHSARPWDGKNAIYEAAPILGKLATLEPKRKSIGGVDFFDVIQVTEIQSESGRTTVPGWVELSINYRFSPDQTTAQAKDLFLGLLSSASIKPEWVEVTDIVPAGQVVESPFYQEIVKKLGFKVEAKQAWTDVAQLAQRGIPAFNCGPGLTAQAHRPDEYVNIQDIQDYLERLKQLLN